MSGPPACRDADPHLFDSTRLSDHFQARRICARCPRVQTCLTDALTIAAEHPRERCLRSPDGTWAGVLWQGGQIVDTAISPRLIELVQAWDQVA